MTTSTDKRRHRTRIVTPTTETLITMQELCERLSIGYTRAFQVEVVQRLRAKGLKVVRAGTAKRFLASSVDAVLRTLAEEEGSLW